MSAPQCIRRITSAQALNLCSFISDWVHRDCEMTGLEALSTQRDLFNGLYIALLKKNASSAALELIQARKQSMVRELEAIYAGEPDLLETLNDVEGCEREEVAAGESAPAAQSWGPAFDRRFRRVL